LVIVVKLLSYCCLTIVLSCKTWHWLWRHSQSTVNTSLSATSFSTNCVSDIFCSFLYFFFFLWHC